MPITLFMADNIDLHESTHAELHFKPSIEVDEGQLFPSVETGHFRVDSNPIRRLVPGHFFDQAKHLALAVFVLDKQRR